MIYIYIYVYIYIYIYIYIYDTSPPIALSSTTSSPPCPHFYVLISTSPPLPRRHYCHVITTVASSPLPRHHHHHVVTTVTSSLLSLPHHCHIITTVTLSSLSQYYHCHVMCEWCPPYLVPSSKTKGLDVTELEREEEPLTPLTLIQTLAEKRR